MIPWRKSENCHFIKRSNLLTRWDGVNCNPGCPVCNQIDDHHKYRSFLVKKYDELTVLKLESKKHLTVKYMKFELVEKLEYFRKEIIKLSK
jgi:hypothetical protein